MMITAIITIIIREVQARLEEETRARAAAQDNLIAADRSVQSALLSFTCKPGSECPTFRRATATKNSLEEARTLSEQSDRTRRNVEQELADTNESLSDLTCQNQAICGAKLKCEQVRVVTINMCSMSSPGLIRRCAHLTPASRR